MNFTVDNLVAVLCFYTCCLATITMATCSQGNCPIAGYFFALGQNMVNNHALEGSVFERSTVSSPVECYNKCRLNCRCISFNYLTAVSQDNCELNDENRYLKPSDLKPKEGSQYYDLVIYYNVKYDQGNNPCPGCQNGCCRSPSPCFSPGTLRCEETCDVNGKRFRCICKSDGWHGDLCDFRTPLFQASSYMMFPTTNIKHKTQIIIRFKPAALNGLLFYGVDIRPTKVDFLSIVLHNGFVKLRYDLGSGVGEARSRSVVSLSTWYTVNASRYLKDGTLILNDDSPVSAVSPGSKSFLTIDVNYKLGGVPDLLNINPKAVDSAGSSVPGFSGCIDYFQVNDVVYSLTTGDALEEENISTCTDSSD